MSLHRLSISPYESKSLHVVSLSVFVNHWLLSVADWLVKLMQTCFIPVADGVDLHGQDNKSDVVESGDD